MIEIREITVLKDGFLIKAPDIEDKISGLLKTYLLVFNRTHNDKLAHLIAEYNLTKSKAKSNSCPEKYLLAQFINKAEYEKARRRLWYDLTQREERMGYKTGFRIHYFSMNQAKGTVNDLKARYNLIRSFIKKEIVERESFFCLGDTGKTKIKFKPDTSVTEFNTDPPLDDVKISDIKTTTKNQLIKEKIDKDMDSGQKDNTSERVNNYADYLFETLPPLPMHEVVGRKKDLNKITLILKKAIQSKDKHHKQKLFIIHGLPGVGKTTLSIVLSHDKHIQSLFKDGIIWTYLGKTTELLPKFKSLSVPLNSIELNNANTIEEAELILKKILKNKNFLIVVDDVWDIQDIKQFLNMSKNTPTILTTRLRDIAYSLSLESEEIYKLDILSDTESLRLFKELVPTIVDNYLAECKELLSTLGGLPLAIRVAGHLLRKQKDYGLSVPKLLSDLNKGRQILNALPPSDMLIISKESTPTVAALLMRSTDFLSSIARECFSLLAFMAVKPYQFDLNEVNGFWKVVNPETIARELLDYGLIEPTPIQNTFQIHYLMVLLARSLLSKGYDHG